MAEVETVAEMLERVGLGRAVPESVACNYWENPTPEQVAEVEQYCALLEIRAEEVARVEGRREALADLARWFREDAAGRADPTSVPLAVVLRRLGVEP